MRHEPSSHKRKGPAIRNFYKYSDIIFLIAYFSYAKGLPFSKVFEQFSKKPYPISFLKVYTFYPEKDMIFV